MKDKNRRKKVVASALVIGAMASGAATASNQMVNATSNDNGQSESSETHKKPELSEEKKAEIKAKLDAMTEEEKKEWLESHKHKKDNRTEDSQAELPAEE